MKLALAMLLSYVLGSIPTGLWLGLWFRGVDIRQYGSKNVGATNTLRVLGKKMGGMALAGDVGKGVIAVLLVACLDSWPYAPLLCGLMAILGHSASLFLKFRGGKGVATSAGVFLALCPLPTLIAAAVFFAVLASTRMVSAGSMAAAVALTGSVYALPHEWATWPTGLIPPTWVLKGVVTFVAVLVIAKHRSNIRRILRGEENRI